MAQRAAPRMRIAPGTALGWIALGLTAASVLLFAVLVYVLQANAAFTLLLGSIGSVVGAIAILGRRDRALLVYLTLVPIVLTVALLVAEFTVME